jgi:hypothetical protein
MIVAAVVAYGLPGDASYEPSSVFGFFMVLFGAGGVVLGAIVALLLDRLSVKRTQSAVVAAVPETGPDSASDDETGPGGQAGGRS